MSASTAMTDSVSHVTELSSPQVFAPSSAQQTSSAVRSSVGPGDGTVTGGQTGDDDSGTWLVIFVLHIRVKLTNSNPKPQVKEKLGHRFNFAFAVCSQRA